MTIAIPSHGALSRRFTWYLTKSARNVRCGRPVMGCPDKSAAHLRRPRRGSCTGAGREGGEAARGRHQGRFIMTIRITEQITPPLIVRFVLESALVYPSDGDVDGRLACYARGEGRWAIAWCDRTPAGIACLVSL